MKVVYMYETGQEIPDGGKYLCTILDNISIPRGVLHYYEFSIGNNPTEKAQVVDEQQLKFDFRKTE